MDNQQNTSSSHVTISKPVFIGLIVILCILLFAVSYLLLQKSNPQPTPTPGGGTNTQPSIQPTSDNQQPGYPQGLPTDTPVPQPTKTPTSPEEVTSTFYNWYFTFKGNPLTSGAYKTTNLLTTAYIADMEGFVKTYTDPKPYDPIFCIKNKAKPENVSYEPAVSVGKKVKVKIRRLDGKYLYVAWLIEENNKWVIDDITCTP